MARSWSAFPAPKPQVSLPIKVVFPAQHLGGTRKALSLPICLSTRCAWLQPEHWCSVGGTTHCSSSSQPSNFTIKKGLHSRETLWPTHRSAPAACSWSHFRISQVGGIHCVVPAAQQRHPYPHRHTERRPSSIPLSKLWRRHISLPLIMTGRLCEELVWSPSARNDHTFWFELSQHESLSFLRTNEKSGRSGVGCLFS